MSTNKGQDSPGIHNAPVFFKDASGKPINTGLQKAAQEDINRRLVREPNKER